MTLSRQLYLLLTLLLFLVFIGAFAISLDNNRDYLAKQLSSTAEDTATSLGLSVTTHLAEKDTATLQSMIDAVFDRGYYRLISLQNTAGKSVHERSLPIVIDKVPPWFIGLFPLETPMAEAQVMNGWNQAGVLKVASHPGYAYDELWRNAQETLIWFLACAILGLLLGSLLLRLILKPLRAVEKQAQSICDREYRVQDTLPWTRELRQVVEAMNRMSQRVGQMFAEQAALTEQLQKDVYIDPVTGLANRKQFDAQMQHLLQSPDQFTESTLMLIQLVDFKGYNDRQGYEAGDALLRRVAEALRETCTGQARLLCRLSGADFAVLTHVRDFRENNQLAERILNRLKSLKDENAANEGIAHIGLSTCRVGQALNSILANADMALRQAQQAGPDQYRYAAEFSETAEATGASQWRERLLGYLQNDALLLHVQPIADSRHQDVRLHHEVLLRAREQDGSLTSAGAFMAMAERTGLAQALDRRVIELAVKLIESPQAHLAPLAINLTPSSVDDADFVTWLLDLLKTRAVGPKLIFEMSEYGVVRFHDSVSRFAKQLRPYGGRFAIDHFGSRLTSFSYLREIRVSYVKLDGSYTQGIEQNKENQVFVRALSRMAHELEIQVIAESVETAAEAQALLALNVDGLQGYHIGKPIHPDF